MFVKQRNSDPISKHHRVAEQTGHFFCGLGIRGMGGYEEQVVPDEECRLPGVQGAYGEDSKIPFCSIFYSFIMTSNFMRTFMGLRGRAEGGCPHNGGFSVPALDIIRGTFQFSFCVRGHQTRHSGILQWVQVRSMTRSCGGWVIRPNGAGTELPAGIVYFIRNVGGFIHLHLAGETGWPIIILSATSNRDHMAHE